MTDGESSQNNLILIFKRKQEVAYFKSCWVLKMDLFMDLSHNQRTNFCSLLSYIRKCSFFLTENADMEGSMCMIKHCAKSLSRVRLFVTSWTIARLFCPQGLSGKNTGVGCHTLLQGIIPVRDRTQVSHIAGRFFTDLATRE